MIEFISTMFADAVSGSWSPSNVTAIFINPQQKDIRLDEFSENS